MEKDIEYLKSKIRSIENFPSEGIIFRDITTLLKDSKALALTSDILYERYKNKGITKVVGIESRGFMFGNILAYRLGVGFVPIRKKGKLPADTLEASYSLEYGKASIEIHKDALDKNDKVLLHDDLLATGGTSAAAIGLIENLGVKNIDICYIIELAELSGRKALENTCKGSGYDIYSIFSF